MRDNELNDNYLVNKNKIENSRKKSLKDIYLRHSHKLDEMNEWGFIAKFESKLLDDLKIYMEEFGE